MKTHTLVIAILVVVGTLIAAAAWSQQAMQNPADGAPGTIPPPVQDGPPIIRGPYPVAPRDRDSHEERGENVDPYRLPVVNPFEQPPVNAAASKIDQILLKLRAADEGHKPELVKDLEKAVSAEFDEDMKQREAELTKLEARVAKLRAQFERRKKAKTEITQLQTKVLVNEVDGLGFSHPQPINADEGREQFWRQPTEIGIIPGNATVPDNAPVPQNPQRNADPFFSPVPQGAIAPPAAMPPAAIAR